jgi:hypothetical protein
MIMYGSNTIIQGSIIEAITRWEVWFRCPYGLDMNFKRMAELCVEHGFDPETSIRPVVFACSNTLREESVR